MIKLKAHITEIPKIHLVGMHQTHSIKDNRTVELWKKFMPRKHEIGQIHRSWHYAVQDYDFSSMAQFTMATEFKIWSAVEVNVGHHIADGMDLLVIPKGKYAVFMHRGDSNQFKENMNDIMTKWLPHSPYEIDDRPHFQIMKEQYLGENNPDSQEEIYLPIK